MIAIATSLQDVPRMLKLILYRQRVPKQMDMLSLENTQYGKVDFYFWDNKIEIHRMDGSTTCLDASTNEKVLYELMTSMYVPAMGA